MFKIECARCGYDEHKGSLHIHHIDGNHDNNNINNLIVLCANCHFGVHHGKFKLTEKQTPIIKLGEKHYNLSECRFDRRDEICYLNEIAELKLIINEIKNQHENECKKISIDIIKKNMIIESMIQYITLHSYQLRENLILLQTVFDAYVHSIVNKSDGWSAYKPDEDMIKIIKKCGDRVIREHYMTPSTDEMKEVTGMKPII